MKKLALLVAVVFAFAISAFAGPYDTWSKYKSLALNTANTSGGANVTAQQDSFPVLVRLTSASVASGSDVLIQALAGGADIRFSDSTGAVALSYEIERWTPTAAEIWVRVPRVLASATTRIRMYWGKSGQTSASNGAAVFTASNSFVGVWHLGNASGIDARPNAVSGAPAATLANDFSGAQFGGGAGSYVIPDGMIGKGDTLRGNGTKTTPTATSDYLNIGNLAGGAPSITNGRNTFTGYSNFSGGFTYSVWTIPNTPVANNSYLIELASTTEGSQHIQFFRNSSTNNTLGYQHLNGTTSSGIKTSNNNTVVNSTSQWQHFTVTVGTGSTPAVNIYKDGVSVYTSTNATNATVNVLRPNVFIGKSNYGADPYYRGSIDEPRLSGVARSANWVKLEYETEKASATALTEESQVTVTAMTGFTYTPSTAVYPTGIAASNTPSFTTGVADSFQVSPALPAGLVLNRVTGVISGIPTAAIPATDYTVTAFGELGNATATFNITVPYNAPSSLSYTNESIVDTVGNVITANSPTVGGLFTSFSVAPALPAGLTLNTATGVISGTPTDTAFSKIYTVTVFNNAGSLTKDLTILVQPAVPTSITYAPDTTAYYVGIAVSNTPTVLAAGTAVVDSFTVSSLPAGLAINKFTGVISGTPSGELAAANYTVTAYNVTGTRTKVLNFSVSAAPTLSYASSTVSYEGGLAAPISPVVPTVTGTVVTWSVLPALPAGLTLGATTGIISGTPTAASPAANYTVKATNPAGSITSDVNITVSAPEAANYAGWSNMKTINLNTAALGVATVQANFPVLVRFTKAHGMIFATANADGSDLRFSKPDGTRLAYEIERWSPADSTGAVWVSLDAVAASGINPIRIHWGKSGAVSKSNGSRVFNRANGYEAVFHLAETGLNAGDITTDATGNGHTGTLTLSGGSAPTDALDGVGVGKTFSGLNTSATAGTGSYFTIADPNVVGSGLALDTKNGPFTISAWAKPTSCNFNTFTTPFNAGRYAIFGKYSAATGGPKSYFFGGNNGNGSWKGNILPTNLGPTASNNELSATTPCTVGNWQFLSVAYYSAVDPSSTAPSSDVFNVSTNVGTAGTPSYGSNTTGGNGAAILLGASDGSARFMNGGLDEITVSKVFRSRDWLALTYGVQKAASNPVFDLAYSAPSYSFVEESPITPIPAPTVTGTATRFDISPSLPPTLTFNTATGDISGTAADGSPMQTYTVTAYGDSAWSTSTTFNLTITTAPPSAIAYTTPINAYVGGDIGTDAPTNSGTVTSWSVLPALPAGLSINSSTGVISGIPTATAATQTYTVTGTGPDGSSTSDVSITVAAAPENFSTWSNSRSIKINTSATGANISGTLTKFPLLVRLGAAESAIFSQALAAGADVRFTKANGLTRLPHQIVTWDAPGMKAEIWVKVDSVFGNNTTQTIKMFWGNASAADSSKGSAVFDTADGYQAVWHMGSGGTGDETDATLNAYTLSAPAAAAAPTNDPAGIMGSARAFANGSTQYLVALNTVTSKLNFGLSGPFTLSAWVNPTTNGQRVIVGKSDNQFSLGENSTSLFEGCEFTTGWVCVTTPAPPTTGVWSQATLIRNGSGAAQGTEALYVNGVLVSNSPSLASSGTRTTTYNVSVGARLSGTAPGTTSAGTKDRGWNGSIDEVRMLNTAVSADYTKLGYESQKALQLVTDIGVQPPTLAYAPDSVIYLQNATIASITPTATGTGVSYSGTLPTGLVVNASTGVISGTPTVPTVKTLYTITATNLGGSTTDSIFIQVNPAAPIIAYATAKVYRVGTAIDTMVVVSTGGPITGYSSVPDINGATGLTLNATTGALTGTPTLASAAADYKIIASGPGGLDTAVVNITVNDAVPVISYVTPKVYQVGIIADTLAPLVTTGPVTSYAVNPDLAAATGLSFNATTGKITGTPALASSAADYTIIATGPGGLDTAVVNIRTLNATPSIVYATPHVYTVGVAIDTLSPASSGGPVSSYAISPSLNTSTGLSFNVISGKITGTPTLVSAAADYRIIATNDGGADTSVVNIAALDAVPVIAYTTPHTYTIGTVIDTLSPASSGGPVSSYAISPSLNTSTGLVFNTATGKITGTPTMTAPAADYTIIATNTGGTDTAVVNITSIYAAPVIAYTTPQVYTVGIPITSLTVASTGGPVTSFAISPDVTAQTGLTFAAGTGQISGTATLPHVATDYTVIVTGPGGLDTAVVNIQTTNEIAPSIVYKDTLVYTKGSLIATVTPDTTGSGPIDSFTVAPSLPAGLVISKTTGAITGTPTTITATANYTVTAMGLGGFDSEVISLTVNDIAPVISYGSGTKTYPVGTAITPLAVTSTGGAVLKYSISPDLAAQTGLVLDTLTGQISGTPTLSHVLTTYVITATNSGGFDTGSVDIISHGPPSITTQPRDTTVVAGVAGTFSVAATAQGTLSYQWKKGATNVGTNSATYSTAATTISDTGSYTVVVTSTLNLTTTSITSTAGILKVNVAPVIATQPHDSTVVSGAAASFTVAATVNNGSSAGAFSYQWKKNGTNVASGGTATTYSVAAAAISDTGSYTVVVTRTLGTPATTTSTTSSAGKLTVNAAPVIATQPRDTTVVAGVAGRFSVSASVSGGGVLSYQWKKGATNVGTNSATYSTAATTISDTGSYTVVVTSTLNLTTTSVTSTAGILKVNVAPVIATAPHDSTVVSGAAASFTVAATVNNGSSAGAFSYQWKKNGTNVASGGTATTYSVAAAAIADTGSYTVVVTRTLGTPATTTSTTSSAGKLTVNAAPVIATQPRDTTVVAGVAGTFSVAATAQGTLSYQWKKGATNVGTNSATYSTAATTIADTGSYTVVVTSTLNLTTTSTTSTAGILKVNVAPVIATQPHDSTVVSGGAASFTVAATVNNGSSAGAFSYQWKKNGSNVVSGGTAATLSFTAAAITDTGSYTVVVTRSLGTPATTTSTTSTAGHLSINVAPVIATQPHDTTVVAGVGGTFTVVASAPGGGVLSYQWRKDGVAVTGATSATVSRTSAAIADTGSYSVVVTSTLNGTSVSTTSSAGNLRVNVAPIITTQPATTQGFVVGGTAAFTVAVAAGAGSSAGTVTYQWKKSGANLANSGTITGATTASLNLSGLALADSGVYTVVITRTLNGTTTTTTSTNGTLTPPVAIMPDAFVIHVNGQERPYAFQLPAGTTTDRLTLSIMDAWGRTVWTQSVNPAKDKLTEVAWNGRSSNGHVASAGMYVVRIQVLNGNKNTTFIRRSVTLKPR